MLVATYAQATLSVEQTEERSVIERILDYLRTRSSRPQDIEPAHLAAQVDQLSQFAEVRHRHKVEGCLMPAVRMATREADHLLAELESLGRIGSAMLRSVRKSLHSVFRDRVPRIKLLCYKVELYCHNVLARLAREEEQLLPLAQRVISSEGWFELGTMFLSHDASRGGSARASRPPSSHWTHHTSHAHHGSQAPHALHTHAHAGATPESL